MINKEFKFLSINDEILLTLSPLFQNYLSPGNTSSKLKVNFIACNFE
jgi:hypothetical protein